MRRLNPRWALLLAGIAAIGAGAAGVYATGSSTRLPAAGDTAASATPTPAARSFSSAICAISTPECNDVVPAPELTCEEAHACAAPTLRAACTSEAGPCGPCEENTRCGCEVAGTCVSPPTPEPCAAPGCHVACPAFAPEPAPGLASDVACPLPTCPAATPVAGSDVAPAIAPYCGPLPCASTEGECKPPSPCAMPDGAAMCPPPRCLPVAPVRPEPGEIEPQTSNPSCPEPLPPNCTISSDGAVSCPTPGASGGGAGSAPPGGVAGATPSIAE